MFGVNGHDDRPGYPQSQAEAVFRLLDQRNLRSHRFDVDPRNVAVLDRLVALSRQYRIALRPMLYPMSRETGYQLARRYAADIKLWEIGNEQGDSHDGAQARIDAMTAMYRGMQQARTNSAPAWNSTSSSPPATATTIRRTRAAAAMDLYLGQMRGAVQKYRGKVLFNEVDCAEVYAGNTDGGQAGDGACYDSVAQIVRTLQTDYADVVAEINL